MHTKHIYKAYLITDPNYFRKCSY